MTRPKRFYALKKLLPSGDGPEGTRKSFNMELSSLLFSQKNAFKARQHLIQILATFEVGSPDMNNSTWYFLFDWADGNLSDFWKNNKSLVRDHRILPWMAAQFYGLCQALQGVHNERLLTVKSFELEEGSGGETLYGRHGDISPSNFLWFRSENENTPGTLTLADFGLGRLHRQVSRSAQDPNSIGRTATYRAPEFDLPGHALISRKADIFSLGCVFLEHVTWFFFGYEEIETRSSARVETDVHQFLADTFFSKAASTGNGNQFVIKQSVIDLVHELKARGDCCLYLQELLDVILTMMLTPDHTKRTDVSRLTKKMHTFLQACKTDVKYYAP